MKLENGYSRRASRRLSSKNTSAPDLGSSDGGVGNIAEMSFPITDHFRKSKTLQLPNVEKTSTTPHRYFPSPYIHDPRSQ